MDFQKLFEMQKGLDEHIEKKHQLMDDDLFEKKLLALLVELGELANETRCFKFWSTKPSSPSHIILEEYVDGIHFILSLGLECGFEKEAHFEADVKKSESLNEQFLFLFEQISRFRVSRSLASYKAVFKSFMDLGEHLGFNAKDIEKAYLEKNEVNYKRQEQGY